MWWVSVINVSDHSSSQLDVLSEYLQGEVFVALKLLWIDVQRLEFDESLGHIENIVHRKKATLEHRLYDLLAMAAKATTE